MINPNNLLKIIYEVVDSDTGSEHQKLELIHDLLNISPYQDIKRIDPPDCGCTDCIVGDSRAGYNELEYEIYHSNRPLFEGE